MTLLSFLLVLLLLHNVAYMYFFLLSPTAKRDSTTLESGEMYVCVFLTLNSY